MRTIRWGAALGLAAALAGSCGGNVETARDVAGGAAGSAGNALPDSSTGGSNVGGSNAGGAGPDSSGDAGGVPDAGGGSGGTGGDVDGGVDGAVGAGIQYAGALVNPINSGDEVLFRRIDVRNRLCVLVDVFILAGGQVQGPIRAYALPADAAQCLTATPVNATAATSSTGTIKRADGGLRFDIDLHLVFSQGYDWLAPSVDFKTHGLALDGRWYAEQ
jgi:hypothetical protein